MTTTITQKNNSDFKQFLIETEKSKATIEKYVREVQQLFIFLCGREITKQRILEYRELLQQRHKARTVNGKLSAINAYLDFAGLACNKVRLLKVQRMAFIDENRELTESEYKRLLRAAKNKDNERLYFVMLTICNTGIRVSELKYITVEAVKNHRAEISLKGKNRIVILHGNLRNQLLQYAKKYGITSGCIFRTRSGKSLDRSNICHDMKKLCAIARVDQNKVFPHNLRHLFARSFYAIEKNLSHLADILGHSSVETTRIYVATSIKEHERIIQKMKLLI